MVLIIKEDSQGGSERGNDPLGRRCVESSAVGYYHFIEEGYVYSSPFFAFRVSWAENIDLVFRLRHTGRIIAVGYGVLVCGPQIETVEARPSHKDTARPCRPVGKDGRSQLLPEQAQAITDFFRKQVMRQVILESLLDRVVRGARHFLYPAFAVSGVQSRDKSIDIRVHRSVRVVHHNGVANDLLGIGRIVDERLVIVRPLIGVA